MGKWNSHNQSVTKVFQCLGHSNWTICSLLSQFCSDICPIFPLLYWKANSYYPRERKAENGICSLLSQICVSDFPIFSFSRTVKRLFFYVTASACLVGHQCRSFSPPPPALCHRLHVDNRRRRVTDIGGVHLLACPFASRFVENLLRRHLLSINRKTSNNHG